MKIITIEPTYAEKIFISDLLEAAGQKAESGAVIRLHLVKTDWSAGKPRGLTDAAHKAAIAMLHRYGVDFTEGNDAPRGGAKGRYIEIRVDRRKAFWTCVGL